jgi:citrate synthase
MSIQSYPGLEGISIGDSCISWVDGQKGRLIYRGHLIQSITPHHTYEDVVHLLWHGSFPDDSHAWRHELAQHRALSQDTCQLLQSLPQDASMMEVIRTALSAMTLIGPHWPPTYEQGIAIVAKIPTIIAYRWHYLAKTAFIPPDTTLWHAENYLYMLRGSKPAASLWRALDGYLMLTADHDMNASTFTARVVTSTQSDLLSALTAAVGALIGPLHGGTPAEVDNMLECIQNEEHIETWLRQQLDQGIPLMGFGHRVYKTLDPRAVALKLVAQKFSDQEPLFALSLKVEAMALKLLKEYKPDKAIYTNLEFWAAGVLRAIGLSKDLYTATFCLSRVGGWVAHCVEQAHHNRLIRPSVNYVGPMPA